MGDILPYLQLTPAHCGHILKIDKDYRNYERVIGEMQAREEDMAATFVEKVRP